MNEARPKADTEFNAEYASAWQRHRGGACTLRCYYCVQANKFRGLTWTFIPSDRYDAYLKAKRREKLEQADLTPKRRIILPEQHRMIQTARRSG